MKGFKNYIHESIPDIDHENIEHLFAKQKSKQVRPDIMLLINEERQNIFLILDNKTSGITHESYAYKELADVNSTNQIIGRGFLPKTYSYEETLQLSFSDGESYQLILENISNKQGTDQGADVVREIFTPWRRKLDQVIKENKAQVHP
ncbi:MAG: hypothetical protein U9R53_12035 [Chloroflexota bacterium]|nr:hypothetical protein [Chloroflexota bacterium]